MKKINEFRVGQLWLDTRPCEVCLHHFVVITGLNEDSDLLVECIMMNIPKPGEEDTTILFELEPSYSKAYITRSYRLLSP